MIYSFVPKTLLVKGSGYSVDGWIHRRRTLSKHHLYFLNNLTPSERDQRLRNYFKFTVVRHPLDRLLSAYRDKVLQENTHLVIRILEQVRPGFHVQSNNVSLLAPEDRPSLAEFLGWLVSPAGQKHDNYHFQPYWGIIHPCSTHWDAILRTETMEEDVETA